MRRPAAPFTGLSPRAFRKPVTVLRREGGDAVGRGRPWSLPLEDRTLLVAAHWRTNSTARQLAPLFGVSKSAADRNIDHLGPRLTFPLRKRFREATVVVAPCGAPVTANGVRGPGSPCCPVPRTLLAAPVGPGAVRS
ncbi:hypothetical protein SCOCK_140127 [Actinacidiphila cocklensis]|uniref:Transposase Helix-turn-helix domain-containing protein n=1 Tax=Actinacidiphila cocklensis TaxID=887465 RepID=A0A9W4DKN0_9ACTN|nr:hypothetical protein SCOCK_140127 [Actinacidiphila cocklensis]